MTEPLLAEPLAEALFSPKADEYRDEDYKAGVLARLRADPRTVEAVADALHRQKLGCLSVCTEQARYPDLSPGVAEEAERLSRAAHNIDAAAILDALLGPES